MNTYSLRTKRLDLRPLVEADWQTIHTYASDPEVVKYMPWGPNQSADTLAYIKDVLKSQQAQPQQRFEFALIERRAGKMIGHCGLKIERGEIQQGSFGYVLHPSYWDQGFATEAAEALLEFGFKEVGLQRLFATCRPENISSTRVLEKIGMRREAHYREHIQIRGRWMDTYLYAIRQEEWQSPSSNAVIFDMDGVIVDSEPLYLRINRKIFKELGISLSNEKYDEFIGVSPEKMWGQVKAEFGLEQSLETLINKEAAAVREGLLASSFTHIPGLTALIERLEQENIPLAVASSSSHIVIQIILTKLNLQKKFNAIVSGEDVVNGKPAPDIFELAAKKLGMPPDKCLVIEDSGHGVRGAKAAGMHCVGYANPSSGNQDLSPADLIIKNYDTESIDNIFGMFF